MYIKLDFLAQTKEVTLIFFVLAVCCGNVKSQTSLLDEYAESPSFGDVTKVNSLKGPFGYKLDWTQLVDETTKNLKIESGGEYYTWDQIHSRYTYFFRSRANREFRESGLKHFWEYVDPFNSFARIFADDNGTIYAAGWRHFYNAEKSIFSIAPVNVGLLKQHVDANRITRAALDEMAMDPGLAIAFQKFSEDDTQWFHGYRYKGRRKGWIELYDEVMEAQPLSDWFKRPFNPDEKVTNRDFANYLRKRGCDPDALGMNYYDQSYQLSALGQCTYRKVLSSSYWDMEDSLDLWDAAFEQFKAN